MVKMCRLHHNDYPLVPVHFGSGTFEPGYNGIGLYDTSSIASDTLWYQLIPQC
jgi:hypothetical protein